VLDLSVSPTPSAAATAIVPAPAVATALRIEPTSLAFLARGAFADLVVTADFDDGSSRIVTTSAALSSANPAVASVNAAGRVVAQGSGERRSPRASRVSRRPRGRGGHRH
jgi:hypothetical protein